MTLTQKIIVLFIIAFLGSFLAPLQAGDGDGGQAGAFLRIPINARANGMGGAFTALATGPSAGWWNPAGLGYAERFQLAAMYTHLSLDRLHNFAGLTIPIKSGAIGINWLQFGVSDIDGRDITGQPTKKFDDNEMAAGLTYALKLAAAVSIGITGKYLRHSLANSKADGYGLDAGIMVNLKKLFHFGFTFQNITGKLKWDTESALEESLPKVYRGGVGVKFGSLPVYAAFDAVKTDNEEGVALRTGSEVWLFKDVFALRGGYAKEQFSAGASVGWAGEGFGLRMDYAFLQDILEEQPTNQVSILINF